MKNQNLQKAPNYQTFDEEEIDTAYYAQEYKMYFGTRMKILLAAYT